jgi:dTDP-4-amino-4,6-dideoxygalactose transaminase
MARLVKENTKTISLFHPYIPQEGIEEVVRVLGSKCITQGPQVDRFERNFAQLFEVKYPVSVSSGTAALELAYELIGLKEGDEVISTPLTCTATNLPLIRKGVKIVWADIKEDTLCIDPIDVHAKFTERTKAVVQVHLGGIGADIGKVHVPVVSDAAQALGIFKGDYTCCSFQAIKHVTTGDGGMLVVSNAEEYRAAKLLRWFGIDREKKSPGSYLEREMMFDIELAGTKRHMNDIAATLGIAGLAHYEEVVEHRRQLFELYELFLNDIPGLKLVKGRVNTYWLVTLLVDNRDDFARMMADAGVEVNVVQVRNDTYKIFGGRRADLPVLNAIEHKYISLPIGMHVSVEDVCFICDAIEKGWG